MSIQMNLKKDATVVVSGEFEAIAKASKAIATAKVSGIDVCDRLVLQKVIDDNDLTAHITYNGRQVFGCRRISNDFTEMKKSRNLSDNMSDETYSILSSMFDYPRVDKQTYIKAYGDSYQKLMNGLIISYHPGMPDINLIGEMIEREAQQERIPMCG